MYGGQLAKLALSFPPIYSQSVIARVLVLLGGLVPPGKCSGNIERPGANYLLNLIENWELLFVWLH